MKKIIILLIGVFLAVTVTGQSHAHEINQQLGRGLNLGNTFESPRENNWGYQMSEAYIRLIADQGFSHLRIPIRWNDYAAETPPYTIEPWFMDTIRKVVDATIENGMYAMINIHHYDEFNDNPDSEHRTRFLAIWKQISQAFREYPDSLLFEFLNEPHQLMVSSKWNEIYKQVLDTVRIDNPTRICVVGPPDWNGVGSVDKLEWTPDTNMILSVHYYLPFDFTHQGASWVGEQSQNWLGTTWDSTSTERQAVINDFSAVRNFAEQHNVPVHVGEFGSYSAADKASRAKWTAFCARTFESFGFSWAYWEFYAGFGVFDPVNGIWRNFLLNALTEHIDPYSIPPDPWDIGNGDFHNGLAGWSFDVQGEAQASADTAESAAVIDVTNADGTDWHVQLSQSGIQLIQGGEYKLSLKAKADAPGQLFKVFLGKNSDPYNAYTSYEPFTPTGSMEWYSFNFTMNDPSDTDARISLILGSDIARFHFDSITLDQLSVPVLVEQISIGPPEKEITSSGGALQLVAEILPAEANNQTITWEVVSGQSLATIDASGLLTATGTGDGDVRVKATTTDGSGVYTETIVSISNQLQVESIRLTPTREEIDNRMGSVWIYAEVFPANASNKSLFWEISEGEPIAEINQSGILTALGIGDGSVTIKATSTDGSNISSEVNITIMNQVLVEQVEIMAAASEINELQGTLQLSALITPENASRQEVAWSITEGKTLAEIDKNGLLTALGNGNGEVIARASASDGSGVYGELSIGLTNQGNATAPEMTDTFKAWLDGDMVRIKDFPSVKERRLSFTSLDGKKFIDLVIPPYTESFSFSISWLPDGFYILKVDGAAAPEIIKLACFR